MEEGGSLGRDAWRQLRRDPVALIGFGLIAFFVLVAIFAPWIAPYDPTDFPGRGTVTPTNIPGPSAEYWFGLDQLGRDEFSRVVYGARTSLLVGVVALLLGMLGGLHPGRARGCLRRVGRCGDHAVRGHHAVHPGAADGDRHRCSPRAEPAVGHDRYCGDQRADLRPAPARPDARPAGKRLRPRGHVHRRSSAQDRVGPCTAELHVASDRAGHSHAWPPPSSKLRACRSSASAVLDPGVPEWGRMLADTQRFLG